MSRKHRWIVAMAALGLFVGALPASLVCAADDPAGGNPPSPRESSTRQRKGDIHGTFIFFRKLSVATMERCGYFVNLKTRMLFSECLCKPWIFSRR